MSQINESVVFTKDQLKETILIEQKMRACYLSGHIDEFNFNKETEVLDGSWSELLKYMFIKLSTK